jgi:hypothetical protein
VHERLGEPEQSPTAMRGLPPGECHLGADAAADFAGSQAGTTLLGALRGGERRRQPGLCGSRRGLQLLERTDRLDAPDVRVATVDRASSPTQLRTVAAPGARAVMVPSPAGTGRVRSRLAAASTDERLSDEPATGPQGEASVRCSRSNMCSILVSDLHEINPFRLTCGQSSCSAVAAHLGAAPVTCTRHRPAPQPHPAPTRRSAG